MVSGPWIEELRQAEPGIDPGTIIVLVVVAILLTAFVAWYEWWVDQNR